ncbi:uncharacterized protein LOC130543239 [Ursus arctos]|uniref:uncharacterized protein LOC130543239 n=1 Tax=Ursus arctos TaxID=9644 RepID=UPI001CF892A6|nr:uncharacterized protein LOC130543239 [Ursus arctos]
MEEEGGVGGGRASRTSLSRRSGRAPPPRLCSGFGARPPAAAQTPPGPTRHPGSVSPTCAGLPRPELYAQTGGDAKPPWAAQRWEAHRVGPSEAGIRHVPPSPSHL